MSRVYKEQIPILARKMFHNLYRYYEKGAIFKNNLALVRINLGMINVYMKFYPGLNCDLRITSFLPD